MAFEGGELERAAHLRGDPQALARMWEDGRVLAMWRGQIAVAGTDGDVPQRLGWLTAQQAAALQTDQPAFLGTDQQGRGLFSVTLPAGDVSEVTPMSPGGLRFAGLREVMATLSPIEGELAATARALGEWHASHGFCAACGQPSVVAAAGWQRRCPACGTLHFPRTDPVVIMLVLDGERLLIGRSPGWPPGMYSALAGFMEPGETIEAAVRREVFEETGVRVGQVGYCLSQPWPFPTSLMIGCRAQALTGEIVLDPAELEDAIWVDRETALAMLNGHHPTMQAPRAGSIARALMLNWLADRLD